MIADALTADRIGLTWLRSAVAPSGAFGRAHDEAAGLYGPGDEAAALAEIGACTALAQRLEPDTVGRLRSALRAILEPGPIVARARAGDPLLDVDFYELGRFVDGVDRLRATWTEAGEPSDQPAPALDGLRAILAPGREGGTFYLSDAFGAPLAAARAALAAAEAEVDVRRAAAAVRVREQVGIEPAGDEFVLLRDVYDGPLPAGLHLVRETPVYRAVAFALDAPARDAAFAALSQAEEHVRRALSERIAREADAIGAATRSLGALDRLLARVAFAQRWGACVPRFDADELSCEDAVFAPLAEVLAERGHRYTPLSFSLRRAAILTGPNMGGKSAALAGAGFLCACAALGVAPPAQRATLPLLERVAWVGGDVPAERMRLLSAYATEVVRGSAALASASPRALVLIDEFARTTGPREGRALLIAFVEALSAQGAFVFAATHFDGVAEAARLPHLRIAGLGAGALQGVDRRELDAALELINAAMDYRIVASGSAMDASDALALARLLGFDDGLTARAQTLHDAPDAR